MNGASIRSLRCVGRARPTRLGKSDRQPTPALLLVEVLCVSLACSVSVAHAALCEEWPLFQCVKAAGSPCQECTGEVEGGGFLICECDGQGATDTECIVEEIPGCETTQLCKDVGGDCIVVPVIGQPDQWECECNVTDLGNDKFGPTSPVAPGATQIEVRAPTGALVHVFLTDYLGHNVRRELGSAVAGPGNLALVTLSQAVQEAHTLAVFDSDHGLVAPRIPVGSPVPSTSGWGLFALTVLLLATGAVYVARRRSAAQLN